MPRLGLISNLTGGAPSEAVLENNYSLLFDGSDEYVVCGDDASVNLTSAFTVTAWVNPSGFSSGGDVNTIIAKFKYHSSKFNGWSLSARDNTSPGTNTPVIVIADDSVFTILAHDTTTPTGTWYHVAATFGSATLKLYVNGDLEGNTTENTTNGGTVVLGANDDVVDLEIGRGNDHNGNCFNGYLDEIGLFNIVLSDAQIEDIYNGGTPNDLSGISGLVAYYRMEEGAGTSVVNTANSGTADGTLTNMESGDWTTTVP